MTLSARMLGLVVAPAELRPHVNATPDAPVRIVVLAKADDASATAAAVALALARRSRASCAIAATWGARGADPPPAGALPAATRLARGLSGRGFQAEAAGQLVRVGFDGDADDATTSWRALCMEAAPIALAVAGPRSEALDHELSIADAVIVVVGRDGPGGLIEATEADAASIGPPVAAADMRLGAASRGLLALGYGVPPRIRSAIEGALG